MSDEKGLLILSVIERNGLSTENEISNYFDFENYILKRELINLQLDRLIEYGGSFIRLTSKGKMIIDRLGLQEFILVDFLDDLGYKEKEKSDMYPIVIQYRENAFANYQNMLCKVRVCKLFVENLTKENNTPNYSKKIMGVMRSFFINELENWSDSSNEVIHKLRKTNYASFKISSIENNTDKNSIDYYTKIYLKIFELKDFNQSRNEYIKFDKNPESIISALNYFQNSLSLFEWFDKLSHLLPNLLVKDKNANANALLNSLNILLEDTKNNYFEYKIDPIECKKIIKIHTRKSILDSDVVDLLFSVSDISEFSRITGITEKDLEDEIREIFRRCGELLMLSENTTPSPDENYEE